MENGSIKHRTIRVYIWLNEHQLCQRDICTPTFVPALVTIAMMCHQQMNRLKNVLFIRDGILVIFLFVFKSIFIICAAFMWKIELREEARWGKKNCSMVSHTFCIEYLKFYKVETDGYQIEIGGHWKYWSSFVHGVDVDQSAVFYMKSSSYAGTIC